MNEDRDTAASAFFPDGVESTIVNRSQLATLVAYAYAEIFELFQSTSPAGHRLVELSDHLLTKIGVVDFREINLGKDHEPPGVGLHHAVDNFLQLFSPHSGEDHNCPHISVVHDLNDALGRHGLFDSLGVVYMIVHVYNVKFGAVNTVRIRVQHRRRMEVLQQKSLFLVRIEGGLVTDLFPRAAGVLCRCHHRNYHESELKGALAHDDLP